MWCSSDVPVSPRPLLFVGAGGLARETLAAVRLLPETWKPLGALDDSTALHGTLIDGVPVLGGLASLPGAVVGGLLLGVAESLAGAYFGVAFRGTLAFAVIVGVLLVRPEGLFGRASRERV